MSYNSEKAPNPGAIQDDAPEDPIPKLDEGTVAVLQAEEDAHLGVKAVEAAEKVYGRYSKWFLFIGCAFASLPPASVEHLDLRPPASGHRIGLASYVYSLDGTTTYNYLVFATSAFDKHSLISTIQVAQSVISKLSLFSLRPPSRLICHRLVACGKPIIAKFADVTSRATAYLIVRRYLQALICRRAS